MEPLNLTRELIQNLMRVVHQHDAQCDEDPMIAAQYLAAVVGLLVGNTKTPPEQKQELMREIHAFGEHVLDDVIKQQTQQHPASPAADPAKAFGIWKPPGA